MIRNINLAIFILFIYCGNLAAQDLHSTLNHYTPLYQNPANTGLFPGSVRLGADYRDQGQFPVNNSYQTGRIFLDAPFSIALRERDWTGMGFQFYYDQAGKLPYTTSGGILSLAHHLSLDKKQKRTLSVGIQYGYIQRRLDDEKIVLESDFVDPGVPLQDRGNFASYNASFNDLNAGIAFKSIFSKTNHFFLGVSAHHLLQTNSTLLPDPNFFKRKYAVQSSVYFRSNRFVFLEPEITVSYAKDELLIMPQFKTYFKLNKKQDDLIYIGAGYRYKDALQAMFGIDYKGWNVGISYDISLTSTYNEGSGGFEIGFYKIFKLPEKPKVDPILTCPRI